MKSLMSVGLVGPLPPPSGGMANQTQQLAKLLTKEGLTVDLIQTNRPYYPAFIGKVMVLRAAFRLLSYVIHLWQAARHVDVLHIMANSGWSWYLFAMPAVWIAKLRGIPSVVNYRGGEAEQFFQNSFARVKPTLMASTCVVVPSKFLQQVFSKRKVSTQIVANIIDIERFSAAKQVPQDSTAPHLLVARNLELIYDNATAIRAFKEILSNYPEATLTIAGTGPEEEALHQLVEQLSIKGRVSFTGRVDTQAMPALYQSAHIMLNPSRVDNMPNSVLESLASGVPVVSTNVGGIPFLVEHERTALLVPPEDYLAMAEAVQRLLTDRELRNTLIQTGIKFVQQFSWPVVREQWLQVYQQAINEYAKKNQS